MMGEHDKAEALRLILDVHAEGGCALTSEEAEALQLIKGLHAAEGKALGREWVLEFIGRPMYLGRPAPKLPKGTKRPGAGRGRPARNDPYQEAYRRRRAMYALLVMNPTSASAARNARSAKVQEVRALIARAYHIEAKRLASSRPTMYDIEARIRMMLNGGAEPQKSTLYRHLAALKRAGIITT